MDKPLHILWLPSWYGIQEDPLDGIFFKDLASALKKEGVQIGVIFPEVRQLRTFSLSGFRNHHFQTTSQIDEAIPTLRLHGWNLFPKMMQMQMKAWCHYAKRLAVKYVNEHGVPDLLHAQSAVWGGIAAREIAQSLSIPYVITEHRDTFVTKKVLGKPVESCWSTPFIRQALDDAAAIISVSSALRQSLKSYTFKKQNEIVLIPNSVDIEAFSYHPNAKKGTNFTFLTVGRLVPRKNISMLLKAFKKAFNAMPDACLEIGGNGPEKKALEQLTIELDLAGQVEFLGSLDRKQVQEAFQRADAFVLSSDNESFGVVCIEAMASGVPVISTRCGGTEDIVTDEVGLFTTINDVDEMASALQKMYDRYPQYDKQHIRTLAKQKYSVQAIVKKHLELYSEIITSHMPVQ